MSKEITSEQAKENQADMASTKGGDSQLNTSNDQENTQEGGTRGKASSGKRDSFGHKPRRNSSNNLKQMPSTPTELASGRQLSGLRTSSCSLEPPVTKATLSELDVPRIVLNPKLRHDINFDPELHFRPNLDGEKGKRKSHRANRFWTALRTQLQAFMLDPVKFESDLAGRDWCLPATLRAIGQILETLVPPEDRSSVEEILNVSLLMQQFSKGVADLEELAAWLSQTLKMHCAPMRDDWVNEMVVQLGAGNQDRDVAMLAQGLQTLLGVLEAMKLDVANHQIRCLRPLLIQDTVEFEQTYFMKKIAFGKMGMTAAHSWFRAAKTLRTHNPLLIGSSQRDMWSFFEGFTGLLLPSRSAEPVPDTFTFDGDRIIKLRNDVLDAINLELCARFFRELNRSNSNVEPRNYLDFQRRQSLQEQTLRASITAILSDTPAERRWQEGAPAIALQILRSTPANLSELSAFEAELQAHLSNPSSPIFLSCESAISAQLLHQIEKVAVRYAPLTTAKLFEISTTSRSTSRDATRDPARVALKATAKQIAHIGTVHWRVWAPLAYLVNPDDVGSGGEQLAAGGDEMDTGVESIGSEGHSQVELLRRNSGRRSSHPGGILAES